LSSKKISGFILGFSDFPDEIIASSRFICLVALVIKLWADLIGPTAPTEPLLKRLQAMIGRLRQGELFEAGLLIIESPEVVIGFLILVQMSRLGCAIYIVVVGSSFEMNVIWTFVVNYCSVTYLVWAGTKLYVLVL
jgi:hypothetical protein